MAKKHLAICDKCRKVENMEYSSGIGNSLPKGWINTERDKDYCSKCAKEYIKHMENFI